MVQESHIICHRGRGLQVVHISAGIWQKHLNQTEILARAKEKRTRRKKKWVCKGERLAVKHIASFFQTGPIWKNNDGFIIFPKVVGTIEPNLHTREESQLHRGALEDKTGHPLVRVCNTRSPQQCDHSSRAWR